MSCAAFCFVLNKKLESSHVGGSFVICESELMEAKHLTVHRLNMTSSNMVCVCVCVGGIRAGRHRVAWQDSDSEARSSHLLLRWSSHHAQYAGLCTLVQRDCSPAWEECKVNFSPWSHDTHSVGFDICIHWLNDYDWWVLSTANGMRVTLGTVVTGGAHGSEPGCWGTITLTFTQ